MKQPQVMTANRLDDGAVVYLDRDARWVEDLASARVAETETDRSAMEHAATQAVADRLVVGPYLFAVDAGDGGPRPISQRERIRAAGPTVGTDLAPAPVEA